MEELFMKAAIEETKKSIEPLKCGAVIVKNNEIIAKACNTARKTNDASAHAEINAIRIAGKRLGTKYLDGCTIYCTCEPCIMCLSAITFSRIEKIVYGTSLRDVSEKEKIIDITLDEFLAKSPRKIEVVRNFMEEECRRIV